MTRRSLGSIYAHGPDAWRVMVTVGIDPQTGKPRRESRVVRGSRRDAERELASLAAKAGGSKVVSSGITVSDYLLITWLPQKNVRAKTSDGYRHEIDAHIVPYLGTEKLRDLDPWKIDNWLARMASDGIPSGARAYARTVLRMALRQAVRWRMLASDPTEAAAVVNHRPAIQESYSPDEAAVVLDIFAGHRLECFIYIALGCGLNRSEMLGLRVSDVAMIQSLLTVDEGWHGQTYGVEDTKTAARRRTIKMPDWTKASLERHLAAERARWGELKPSDFLFRCLPDAALEPSTASRWYKERMDEWMAAHPEAGLRYIPLKNLRHSHATIALGSGTDVAVLAKRLGHADPSTTTRFYLKPGSAEDGRASDRFEKVLRPTAGVGPKSLGHTKESSTLKAYVDSESA